MEKPSSDKVDELLDEESIAVLAILLAVALEFGFGFAKTITWWAGLIAGPAALLVLVACFRMPRTHVALVRTAAWVVRPHDRRKSTTTTGRSPSDRSRPGGFR